MILVDFSHLSRRNLYVAISQIKPKKVSGKYITSDFIKFYYHLMLKSLRLLSVNFKSYGEIVLAIDGKDNWRKDFYSLYKNKRSKSRKESDINFKEFFEFENEFKEILGRDFPYKLLEVYKCEGDDIIGVLSKYTSEDTVAVSSDKDFKQILEFGVVLYDPIKKIRVNMSKDELRDWKLEHILLGDDGDDVPHIKRGTEFTPNFISFLKENEIYIDNPEEFELLEISESLYDKFDIYRKDKHGDIIEKDIFKVTRFGPSGIKKFKENLQENLASNRIYKENFERNKKLVLFSKIPEEIQKSIIEEYEKLEFSIDPNNIMNFLSRHNLTEHLLNVTEFYTEEKRIEKYSKDTEWL